MNQELRAHIGKSWRVVIPVEVREKLALAENDQLIFEMEAESIRLTTTRRKAMQALERIWKNKDAYASSDELIAWRRQEAEKENQP